MYQCDMTRVERFGYLLASELLQAGRWQAADRETRAAVIHFTRYTHLSGAWVRRKRTKRQ